MQVGIVQAWNDTATIEINDFRVRPALAALGVVHAHDAAVSDRHVFRFRVFWVERGDASVVKNQIWCGIHDWQSIVDRIVFKQ